MYALHPVAMVRACEGEGSGFSVPEAGRSSAAELQHETAVWYLRSI